MVKKRVLVVDDEEVFLSMIKVNLEGRGHYEVLTLSTTKDILSHINSFKPHVILLDLLIPSIGGLEVCEMLNNDPALKNIPLIIVSALDKDTDKLKAYKLGVVDYLVKPITIDEVISSVEKALQYREIT